MKQKIFCLVLNYRNHFDTVKCIDSLIQSDLPRGTHILIVDNSPTNASAKYLSAHYPDIKLIRNRSNLGFAGGNNVGIKYALSQQATHLLIINPDVTIGKKFFRPLLKDLNSNRQLGLIAPAIRHSQGDQQLYGLEGHIDWRYMKAFHTNLSKPPKNKLRYGDFVTFACVLIKSEVFTQAGLLDQRYFMYLEDVDYCLSANRRGFRSVVDPSVIVDHRTSSSFKRPTDKLKLSFVSQLNFIAKWQTFPRSIRPFLYTLAFYPYLYLIWTVHSLRHRA